MEPGFDWKSAFPGFSSTLTKLREKFGSDLTEMAGLDSKMSFMLAPGPQLYIVAKEPLDIKSLESQIISHGPGSWLTGEKATKFETNTPGRGTPCKIASDQEACVFEEPNLHPLDSRSRFWFVSNKHVTIMYYKTNCFSKI